MSHIGIAPDGTRVLAEPGPRAGLHFAMMVLALFVIIGSLEPWISADFGLVSESADGSDVDEGKATLAFGCFAFVIALPSLATGTMRRSQLWTLACAFAVTAGLAASTWAGFQDIADTLETVEVEWGVVLVTVSAAAGVILAGAGIAVGPPDAPHRTFA